MKGMGFGVSTLDAPFSISFPSATRSHRLAIWTLNIDSGAHGDSNGTPHGPIGAAPRRGVICMVGAISVESIIGSNTRK